MSESNTIPLSFSCNINDLVDQLVKNESFVDFINGRVSTEPSATEFRSTVVDIMSDEFSSMLSDCSYEIESLIDIDCQVSNAVDEALSDDHTFVRKDDFKEHFDECLSNKEGMHLTISSITL